MTGPLADYAEEREFFRSLLVPGCRKRILSFRGESGTGKTALLTVCQEELQDKYDQLTYLPIQLRGGAVSVTEIFYRLARRVGWEHLPQFAGQVARQQRPGVVRIDDVSMQGTQNQIRVALNTQDPLERSHLRAALTDAWFGDLETLRRPLLLVMDTYEAATTEVKDWIAGPFLGRVATGEQVRVLVAGQEVPDANNIEWGSSCEARDLFGVREARHWMPVVEAMNRYIDDPHPLSWLAAICHAFEGRPSNIIQVIRGLPQRLSQA